MAMGPGTRESYIGVFLENIVYGLYLSVFIETCVLLARKYRNRSAKQIYMVGTTILMFILITMRCVIDTVRCIVAFKNDDLSFGPPNTTMGIVTNACWFFVTAVADAFIIFRTWIVWNKKWYIIVLPSLLFVANFGSSIWLIHAIMVFDPNTPIFGDITKSVNAFIYLTLFTNVTCTCLISYRLFSVRRGVSGMVTKSIGRTDVGSRITTIIVESAAVYTLLLIGQLITNRLGSFTNYIIVNCTPAAIGLVFSYIIIRVSRGSSYGDSSGNVDTSLSRERGPNQFELSQTRNNLSGTRSQVQVRLETVTHHHSDLDSVHKDDSNSGKYPDGSVV
ncbi:hypothetical protein C8R43DRAFT_1230408 [Mycena crocata]|nr:hypothetical protein C8R43DRAFT_1230408 [Mycena crocata]